MVVYSKGVFTHIPDIELGARPIDIVVNKLFLGYFKKILGF